MCNIRENCIKYGIPNPSKEERKLIKKKVTDDSSDEEDIVSNFILIIHVEGIKENA